MSQLDGESKYAHLLKPIRDLTTNWNIDIAHDLEDYLEELESLSIAFDEDTPTPSTMDGSNAFNFAEAALLIQGTACIYSRKVEYLYALVYQTLDHLTQQKNALASTDLEITDPTTLSSASTRRSRKTAATTAASSLANILRHIDVEDPEENVLPLVSLEHLEKCCISNNSPSGEEEGAKRTKMQPPPQHKRNKANFVMGDANSGHNFQASIALMASLVPDDHDHGDYFKLQTCQLHENGALMMDSSMKTLLDTHPHHHHHHDSKVHPVSATLDLNRSFLQQSKEPEMDEEINSYPDDFGGNDDDDDDDDGDDDVATEFEHHDDHHNGLGGEIEEEEEDWDDPWVPLDPFHAKSAKSNPFRKAATYDKHVLKKMKRMKEKKMHQESLTLSSINVVSSFDTFTNVQLVTGPMTAELMPVWKANQKKTRELWKMMMMMMQTQAGNSSMTGDALFSDDDDDNDDSHEVDDQGGWANNHGDEEDDDDDDHHPMTSSSELHGTRAKFTDEDRFSQSMSLNQAFQNVSQPSLLSMSIEDQCRSHYNAFTQGAETYANESDLSKQIATWQNKLIPILEEEDSHPPFDIHDYGDEIVQRLQQRQVLSKEDQPVYEENEEQRAKTSKSGQIIEFDQVIEGLSPYEICRIFLASLQLANNGNIELVHGQNSNDQEQVPFQIQLLTTSNCYASIQTTAQN